MNKLSTIVLVGLLLGSVVPAQAQSTSFGIFFGDERSDFLPDRFTCLGDRAIRQAVADRGYTKIFLNIKREGRVQVRASRDGWTYLLEYNYCTNRIEACTQLRPAG